MDATIPTLCAVDALAHVEPFEKRILVWTDLSRTLQLEVRLWRAVNGQRVVRQLISRAWKCLSVELERSELHVITSVQFQRSVGSRCVLNKPTEQAKAVTHNL